MNLDQIQAVVIEPAERLGREKGFDHINLSRNKITALDATQLQTNHTKPESLDLSENQIKHIDNDVFQLLNQWRARSRVMQINLKSNPLQQQRKRIRKSILFCKLYFT